jgi:hypothetical protein
VQQGTGFSSGYSGSQYLWARSLPGETEAGGRGRIVSEQAELDGNAHDDRLAAQAGSTPAGRSGVDRATASYDVAVLGRVHLAAVFALLKGHATPEDDELDRAVNFLIRGAALRDTPKP